MQYKLTKNCLSIFDSYKVTKEKDMITFLTQIRYENPYKQYIIWRRSIQSLVNEWKAHNLLYNLHLFRSHTQTVDLDDEPWYRRSIYWILSKLYFK